MNAEIQAILNALSAIRISAQPEEAEIHSAVAQALNAAGIAHIHEYKLAPGQRIDFISGKIGIEVKKSRPAASQLRRQLTRYLENAELDAMIVVLQKPCALPACICAKPVYVVALNRLWGVALR